MAVPAALAIGRGRGWAARLLLGLLPLSLLYPSIAYTYGWSHVLLLTGKTFEPAGTVDVLRCVWTLATWLWALPAVGIGLALRHLDVQVQQQAVLDGGLWRVTARLLLGPAFACFSATLVLAIQEFAVYEPTGISVMATEIRTVFETGAPGITPQNIVAVTSGADAGWGDQSQRSAAAVATALPLLGVVLVLFVLAAWGMRGFTAAEAAPWSRALDAGRWPVVVSYLLWALNVLTPTAAMVWWLSRAANAWSFWHAAQVHVAGSIFYGVAAGTCALLAGFLATSRRSAWLLAASIATFLIGGQLLAIADIRIYNQRTLLGSAFWVGLQRAIDRSHCVHRAIWLAGLAGRRGHLVEGVWRAAGVGRDGRGGAGSARPRWWSGHYSGPMVLGAAVLVMVLSLTELPSTVLLVPLNPQVLVTLLTTWVHQLRYDAMLLGSLLLVSMTALLGVALVLLVNLGVRLSRWRLRAKDMR